MKEKTKTSKEVFFDPKGYDFDNEKDRALYLSHLKLENERENSETVLKSLCAVAEIEVEDENMYSMANKLIEWIQHHK